MLRGYRTYNNLDYEPFLYYAAYLPLPLLLLPTHLLHQPIDTHLPNQLSHGCPNPTV